MPSHWSQFAIGFAAIRGGGGRRGGIGHVYGGQVEEERVVVGWLDAR